MTIRGGRDCWFAVPPFFLTKKIFYNNAVPSECEIYLDRRLRLGETVEQVKAELDSLIDGKPRAVWEPGILHHTSTALH